ncbi:MAG TPA: M23 family metallopeptidase [Bdellovibrionota bacterium]|jgi:murein DD-endopeptidase MepM/ murein hydrolase activator NlpD|nr:M23 family metallopeptidase [Bdellovibrionota bacterium]
MAEKNFTFLIVPDKGKEVKKFAVPAWYIRLAMIAGACVLFLGSFVFFDYLHVLTQVAENKRLRAENNMLRSDLQGLRNKLEVLDQNVGRLRSFGHKLRAITDLGLTQSPVILEPRSVRGVAPPPATMEDELQIEGDGEIGDPQSNLFEIPGNTLHDQLERQRLQVIMGELGQVSKSNDLSNDVGRLSEASDSLNSHVKREESNFAYLQERLQAEVTRLRHTPSIMPTQGWISSEFGYRYNPFSGRRTLHSGLDIANYTGTPIYASADGTITYAGVRGGFGLVVKLDHGYDLATLYGHLSEALVQDGQKVKRGELIARMGNSGRSTASHLHYQVEYKRRPVNPRFFILDGQL